MVRELPNMSARRVLMGLSVIAFALGTLVTRPASADPPRLTELQNTMDGLLAQAGRRINEGKYEDAKALVDAAALLSVVIREYKLMEHPVPTVRRSNAAIIERNLSTRR